MDTDLLVALYEKNYRIEKPASKISSIRPVHVPSNIRYLGVAAALLVLMLLWFLDSSRDKVSQIGFVEDATIESVVDSHHTIPVINSHLPANQSVVESPEQQPAMDPVGDLDSRPDIGDEIIVQADPAIPEHVLKLDFSGDCWVEVKDAEGKTLLSALKRLGDKVELDGIAPFNVLLGYAPVVTVSYNDEPIAIDVNPRSQAARLVVGRL